MNDAERVDLLEETERLAGLGSYRWRVDGEVTWSAGMRHLLGVHEGQVPSGELFFSLIYPEDLPAVVASYQRARDGASEALVYRIIRPDGTIRWLRGQAISRRDDDGVVVHGVLADVTESWQTSEALARTNAVLAETQRAAGVGSFTWDLASGRWEWSDELYRVVGFEPSIVPDHEFESALVDGGAREAWRDWRALAAAGAEPQAVILRIRRRDGRERVLEVRGRHTPARQVVGVCIDITERTDLEDQLRHAVKMEAVGSLAAGVAHDFNNALTVLTVHLDVLSHRAGSRLSAPIGSMRHAVEQCVALTRQLLSFSRRQPTAPSVVDAAESVRRIAALLERVVGPEIAVETSVPSTPVPILVDPGQMDGALMNLVVNARDAMPGGGHLLLQVGVDGDLATLTVTDTGTGISPEHLSRIFDPYFSTKGLGRGTGLGLASVYSTARQHGGTVRVDSAVGKGSSFHLVFPVVRDGAAVGSVAPPRPATGSHRRPRPGRLLVVEDVDELRAIAREILASAGWTVLCAADGLEALSILSAEPDVALLLTDLRMPKMDGPTLIRAVQQLYPRLPVVAMTGFADPASVEELGVRWVTKPFDVDALIAVVDAAFQAPP